jgi:undecaprenyl-diphosphatase
MLFDLIKAVVLGIVEGLTEFLPVSSTGHLLLLEHFFGFDDDAFGKTFVVLIQLGAILAILSVYFHKLWAIAIGALTQAAPRRFILGVLIAFLPAAVIGALLHSFIKGVLFNVWIVCIMLIVGGGVLLWIDRLRLKPVHHDATQFPLMTYLIIGLCQCLAMIPGVSRSGATIVSAMLLGADKRSAAEFSFYLAMPTMAGAFAYDLMKNWGQLGGSNWLIVVVGFATSFVAAFIVVKSFLDYVSSHGFALFAWWRIIVGALGLIGLGLFK